MRNISYLCNRYMKKLQWGFIGCGEVTEKKSGPAFSEVEGSSVVAVMSRQERKARSYAERHDIPKWYTDGKPVYVEKPLAASYEDCARINRISEETGVPCFVAYYRRYLPYFQKVKDIIQNGSIGKVINVQVRFAVPPRELDYNNAAELPWRLQPDIAGGGYFYDLAPHQLDLLQDVFGVILEARGIRANRGGLYKAEDSVSACFEFESGLPASGSWCFVAHESAREDRIHIIGDKGSLSFSVFDYKPIHLITSEGEQMLTVPNPPYVQYPLIKNVCEHLQGIGICECTSVSATPVNWVLDRILGKF